MIMTSIRLHNFRQFMGEQALDVSVEGPRIVTLVFGANGAGKTTLLNAFTWALYGAMSEDVEEQERLITDWVWSDAKFEAEVPISVEVEFTHGRSHYRVRRSASVRKRSQEQPRITPSLQMWETQGGLNREVDAPQSKIDSILPQRLSRFFFFNGERIDKLVHRKAYAEVKQDIKSLLGLEQVERALVHLPKVERKLGAELRKHGGEQAAEIQSEIEALTEALIEKRSQRAQLSDEVGELNEEYEVLVEKLRQHAEAGPLQKLRDDTESQLASVVQAKKQREDERRLLVASKGYLSFAGNLSVTASELANKLHERGSLPAPLKREFVESLIENGRCICGTDLAEGSSAMRHVADWRAKAGLAEVEAAWQRLSGLSKGVGEARSELRERLQSLAADVERDRRSVDELEGRLTEIKESLKKLPLEEVARLEQKRESIHARIQSANQRIGVTDNDITELERDVESLKRKLKEAEVGDANAQRARRRLELVGGVEKALQEILAIRSHDMKVRLDAKVKQVFANITVKPFYPALSDDFELGLYQDQPDGTVLPVPKSTGENQILSLSFVAAVSELAREVAARQGEDEDLAEDAGRYPIVMDAAFGSLDLNYQRDVSRALAEMAPQMIVLVSKSQGQGQVIDELNPHLSHLGVVVAHSSSAAREPETIVLGGYEYPYITTASDLDWAELVAVKP